MSIRTTSGGWERGANAVRLDALVIRCLAVPATMLLLGAKAWWLPRGLDRRLPDLHIEGRGSPPSLALVDAEPEVSPARV